MYNDWVIQLDPLYLEGASGDIVRSTTAVAALRVVRPDEQLHVPEGRRRILLHSSICTVSMYNDQQGAVDDAGASAT